MPKDMTVGMEQIIDSLNIAVASYGFVINLFPIQADMRHKSKVTYSVVISLTFVIIAYTTLSLLACLSFGIKNIQPSVFENIQYDQSWFSVVLRCLFMLIFICNIPFIFFPAKQATLSIIELCGCCGHKKDGMIEDGEYSIKELDDSDNSFAFNTSVN